MPAIRITETATETFLFDNVKGEPTGLHGKKHTHSAAIKQEEPKTTNSNVSLEEYE